MRGRDTGFNLLEVEIQDRFELSLEQGSRGLGAKLVDGVEPGSELGLIRPGAEEEIGRERASATEVSRPGKCTIELVYSEM